MIMSGTTLPIYRLPLPTSTRVGQVRVVIDRNNQHYINDRKVISAVQSGDFSILTLANDAVYYVKTKDYEQLRHGRAKR
jgi:hypothetical protein